METRKTTRWDMRIYEEEGFDVEDCVLNPQIRNSLGLSTHPSSLLTRQTKVREIPSQISTRPFLMAKQMSSALFWSPADCIIWYL